MIGTRVADGDKGKFFCGHSTYSEDSQCCFSLSMAKGTGAVRFIERTVDSDLSDLDGDASLQQQPSPPTAQQQPAREQEGSRKAEQGQEDACDEEHGGQGQEGQQAGSRIGREEDRPTKGKGSRSAPAQGGVRKPQVSQERLRQLSEARARALEVRKERGELRRREKQAKEAAFEARRQRLIELERKLARETGARKRSASPEPADTPSLPSPDRPTKKSLSEPVPPVSAPAVSDCVDQCAPEPVARQPLKPPHEQATEELRKEQDMAAMLLYRQKVEEAKRKLLMQACFGAN